MESQPEVIRVWDEYLASYAQTKTDPHYRQTLENRDAVIVHIESLLRDTPYE